MSYIGTGTATKENPIALTFPFDIQILFFGHYFNKYVDGSNQLINAYYTAIIESLPIDNTYTYLGENDGIAFPVRLKSSNTIEFCGVNNKNQVYVVGAIGGRSLSSRTDWLITDQSTKTWIAPRSRKYYIELYGKGGRTNISVYDTPYYQSRSSCQSYTLNLQKGVAYSVSLGVDGNPNTGMTTFGEYSVMGGGDSTASAPRKGAGNLGTDGVYKSEFFTKNYSKGILKESFGWGTNGAGQGSTQYGGPSAIYIKYLGD